VSLRLRIAPGRQARVGLGTSGKLARAMGYGVPSVDELRRRGLELGVAPSEEDLEKVRGFLEILLPQIDTLETLVPPDAVPAAIFPAEAGA
jgi:hypothetical protein